MRTATRRRPPIVVLACLLAGVLLAGPLGLQPAGAAGRVSVTSSLGNARVHADQPTEITVSGSGFQSIQGGFGGIYVLFGWVSDPGGSSWRPSQGGATGKTYIYVPDSESKDNAGYQRFVTFPGSSTAEAANGGELAPDGTFSFTMVIPGPTFVGRDRAGAEQEIDCLSVTCGIITVGAHGVANENNESFTPVSFEGAAAEDDAADEDAPRSEGTGGTEQTSAEEPTSTESAKPSATPSAKAAKAGAVSVGVDQQTVVAGRVVAFTGQGFQPGEQVVASLSGGLTAVGPLGVGESGEVAGVLSLPAEVRPGTHTLTLTGAASKAAAEVELQIVDDPVRAAEEANAAEAAKRPTWIFWGLVAVGAVLAILLLSSAVTAIVRRTAKPKGARGTAGKRTGGDR